MRKTNKPGMRAKSIIRNAVERATSEGRVPRLLFVCLGNICRSPAAQGIMESVAAGRGIDVECDSAGFYGGHAGDLPDRRMREAAVCRGYRLDHRARKIHSADLDDFDVVFGMDESNLADLRRLAGNPSQFDKIVGMADFAREHPYDDVVPDPYYGGTAGFHHVLDLLEDACTTILDEMEKPV